VDQITLVIRFSRDFRSVGVGDFWRVERGEHAVPAMARVVVLKTRGPTRNRIATVFSVEFVVLGLLAGRWERCLRMCLSRILPDPMDVVFQRDVRGSADGGGGTALLAVATGWIASSGFWGRSRWKF